MKLNVCLYLIQIHISEPIWTKLCTQLPLGLEETVGYVWTHNVLPFWLFRRFPGSERIIRVTIWRRWINPWLLAVACRGVDVLSEERSGEVWVGVVSSWIVGVVYRRRVVGRRAEAESTFVCVCVCVCVRASRCLHIPVIALFCFPPEGKTKNIVYPTALQWHFSHKLTFSFRYMSWFFL
jgi:hypothetical protein